MLQYIVHNGCSYSIVILDGFVECSQVGLYSIYKETKAVIEKSIQKDISNEGKLS